MKIIEVKDQIEGGKVAFDILKETFKGRCSNLRSCDWKQSP